LLCREQAVIHNGALAVLVIGTDKLVDRHGQFASRFCLPQDGAMLIRPDGHVAARTEQFSQAWMDHAMRKAMGFAETDCVKA
jgi:hypothetical protein